MAVDLKKIMITALFIPCAVLASSKDQTELNDCLRLLRSSVKLHAHLNDINKKSGVGLEEFWPMDGSIGGLDYNDNYREALEGLTIEEWAKARKQNRNTTHVLDLFGSAVFSKKPQLFDSLTGVRLRPMKDAKLRIKSNMSLTQWQEVYGDLLKTPTWLKIYGVLRGLYTTTVDLVIINPVGPLGWVTSRAMDSREPLLRDAFYLFSVGVLNKAWQILSSEHGIILVRINCDIAQSPEFFYWLKVQQARGVNVEHMMNGAGTQTLRLIKTPSSPDSLLLPNQPIPAEVRQQVEKVQTPQEPLW